MPTTIQVSEHMIQLLKRLKEEMKASSYEEALERTISEKRNKKSLAGSLGRKSSVEIMKGLKDKHDKF